MDRLAWFVAAAGLVCSALAFAAGRAFPPAGPLDDAYDQGFRDAAEQADDWIDGEVIDVPGPDGPSKRPSEGALPGPGAPAWEPDGRLARWAGHTAPLRTAELVTVIDWDGMPWHERLMLEGWDDCRRLEREGWQVVRGERAPDAPDWAAVFEVPEWAAA